MQLNYLSQQQKIIIIRVVAHVNIVSRQHLIFYIVSLFLSNIGHKKMLYFSQVINITSILSPVLKQLLL